MTEQQAKREFYLIKGFTQTWPEYLAALVERDEREKWLKDSPMPTLPPLKEEKRKKHYISLLLP